MENLEEMCWYCEKAIATERLGLCKKCQEMYDKLFDINEIFANNNRQNIKEYLDAYNKTIEEASNV
jgi:hypothetical protein